MELYEAIQQRRTIRDLDDSEIPMGIIYRIIEAGLKAPTNDHMRNWEFVVITDKEEKLKIVDKIPSRISSNKVDKILESWNMRDECQRAMYIDAIPKQHFMLNHSGCLILPLFKQDYPLLKPESLSSLNGFASIWCCIENILLAATAEGLSAALRIPFDREASYLQETLGHPDNYIIPCYLALGYPAENAVFNIQKEIDVESRIHVNRWNS